MYCGHKLSESVLQNSHFLRIVTEGINVSTTIRREPWVVRFASAEAGVPMREKVTRERQPVLANTWFSEVINEIPALGALWATPRQKRVASGPADGLLAVPEERDVRVQQRDAL